MEGLIGRSRKPEEVGINEIFTLKRGEKLLIGSDPTQVRSLSINEKHLKIKDVPDGLLSPCELEISLNNDGNPRIIRIPSRERHTIYVWGQDKTQGNRWYKSSLVTTLPNSIYDRFDGGSVTVDIQLDSPDKKTVLRLNDAGRSNDSRSFRVELNPEKLDLSE